MKNNLRKFIKQIGKTQFIWLCFIPFGAYGFYSNGWLGLLVSIFGWWFAGVLVNWRENKQRLKKFLMRRTDFQIKLMVKLPIFLALMIYFTCEKGWKGFFTVIAGWCFGELICRYFKLG